MGNVYENNFMKKFSKLTPQNQRYLVSIQEALSFAQNEHTQEENNKEMDKESEL